MNRRQYLFSYDMSDDKRRNRVFETLGDFGDRVQFSVFFCELSLRELADLRSRLEKLIHPREDQVIILDLGKGASPLDVGLSCLGRAYEPAQRVTII